MHNLGIKPDSTIFILTGAGISAESGLATFRDNGGLWDKFRIEDVATPQAFAANPEMVFDFYNYRRLEARKALPNTAHQALAQLQRQWQGDVYIVTQNVDDLHEKAGSDVFHMHGQLNQALCTACGQRSHWIDDLNSQSVCPHCGLEGSLRPDIVWFGEMPYYQNEIEDMLARSDVMISIGTSGQVYPAAGFVNIAHIMGALTIELNMEATGGIPSMFDKSFLGPATEVVPHFVESLNCGGNRS